MLAINTVFVAAGLFMLPHEPDGGIVTLAFFGSCLAISAGIILRKLRHRRFSAERIDVAGGVPIRPTTTFMVLLSVWLSVLGIILFVFGHDYPLIFRAIAVFIAVVGVVLLALCLTGRWPGGFLQFDPEGLTIAKRGWQTRIAWDDIAAVHEAEFASNPVLLVTVSECAPLDFEPPEARDRAMREIGRTQAMMGADFAVMTQHYGIDLPVLAATVSHYTDDTAARTDLRPRLG